MDPDSVFRVTQSAGISPANGALSSEKVRVAAGRSADAVGTEGTGFGSGAGGSAATRAFILANSGLLLRRDCAGNSA